MFRSKKPHPITPAQVITLGFATIILFGALLLCLPIATKDGLGASFPDALFTATSATCVTGLILHDTFTYWSFFGQFIILLLIQIGGMGVVTISIVIFTLSGKRISLKQRYIMQESISISQNGGIIRFTIFILQAMIVMELLGAFLLSYRFIPRMGIAEGVWAGLFHSISAFCNAGFDLMGQFKPYDSLCSYVGDPLINIVLMLLIIIGGIGFMVWDDLYVNRLNFRHYRFQTKLVLIVTSLLILFPTLFFFFYELSLPQWDSLSGTERLFAALFQAVTPRTAGFNTIDQTALSPQSVLVTILLMLIGGSPASTAGGLKTTTIAVIILCMISFMRRRDGVEVFNRRIPPQIIANAVTLLAFYLGAVIFSSLFISILDGLPVSACLFETSSAIATVGLSVGVSAEASLPSRIILILLMYLGRVGGLTLIYAVQHTYRAPLSRKPLDSLTIG